jgi:GT2 family glycosyltransferase
VNGVASISIIIPIFNQLELAKQCLSSVLNAKVESRFKVICIDDASTDGIVADAFREYLSDDRVSIWRNNSNVGFTQTANRGLQALPDTHPLLLNSDTVVYDHWLDVMIEALESDVQVCSVNPVTNQNGSHISCYPRAKWGEVHRLPISDRKLAEIAFEEARSIFVPVHTNVGFCMLINRRSIHEIGFLDCEHFPRGYGEESDFCYRARKLGWRHLVAGGVFVTHLHGKSFGDEKATLREQMLPIFRRLHPDQTTMDAAFRTRDPLNELRLRLDFGRLKQLRGNNRMIRVVPLSAALLDAEPVLALDPTENTDGVLRFAGSWSDTFPNLPSYRLPNDLERLALDLEYLGYQRVIFDEAGAVCNEIKKYDQHWRSEIVSFADCAAYFEICRAAENNSRYSPDKEFDDQVVQ